MKWKEIDPSDRIRLDVIEDYKRKDAYEILKVGRSESTEEVRKAYRRLMRVYHPDRSDRFLKKTNEEITKLINSAYESIMRERNEHR